MVHVKKKNLEKKKIGYQPAPVKIWLSLKFVWELPWWSVVRVPAVQGMREYL